METLTVSVVELVYHFNENLRCYFYISDNVLRAWVKKNNWKEDGQYITVAVQEGNIKTKHITEKIDFENLAPLMANCL